MSFKSKLKNLNECRLNSSIYKTYYNSKIDEKIVYLESRNGSDFTGNIFRIAEEISTGRYGNFKIYVFAKERVKDKIKQLEKNYNLNIHKIITDDTQATRILHKAKYIFTDSGVRDKYVKKEGQIFVNTWHGTPLKHLGFDNVNEKILIGIIQRCLLFSDYLLYPNDYMADKILNSFMIEKIYSGKILLGGYPRNSVFLKEDKRDEFREKFGFENKEVFVYMPTHRNARTNVADDEHRDQVTDFLKEIDEHLKDNQILITKLHPYNLSEIDFSSFSNVIPFPEGYEIYDIVNMADCLITDYSSVFFDFANTKRKIIIFNYDEEEYMENRGTYFPLSDLPFPKVKNVGDLIEEMNSPKDYDDSEFIENFCRYDCIDSAENICQCIFQNRKTCEYRVIENDKANILIYCGSLMTNGITSSLINLLENLDTDRYNLYLSFRRWDNFIKKNYEDIFEKIPDGIEMLPFSRNTVPTIREKINVNKYFKKGSEMELPDCLRKFYKRSFKRQYGNTRFDMVIDFDGYNHVESLIFACCGIENAIWVHNDMVQEIRLRSNQNYNILKDLYSKSDNVCIVSPDLAEPTYEISGRKDNIRIVHNIDNYKKAIRDSESELEINDFTVVYPSEEKLLEILNSDSKKFINIGRFSPEKGHERLLKAFDEFSDSYPDTKLIIIGGHGVLYDKTLDLIENLRHGDNVVVIKNISNPMPILKQCDLFIISSFYEGWPIVIMEADALSVPIIATDITGTQWMRQYNGFIVENSQNGIYNGMNMFMDSKVHTLDIDFDEYNQNAVDEFYDMIDTNIYK